MDTDKDGKIDLG